MRLTCTLASCALVAGALGASGAGGRPHAAATLAFARGGDGRSGIWLVQADGRRPHALTRNAKGTDEDPAWSPDGTRIAFARSVDRGKSIRIYVMNADGRGLRAVSQKGGRFAGSPSRSPDSRRIVFTGSGGVFGECHSHAFVVRPDGTGFRRLVRLDGYALDPVWSPDGTRLALVRIDAQERAWIFLGTSAGTKLRRLTLGSHPSWSPDGRRVAFMRDSGGVTRIFVIRTDGRGLRRVTKSNDFELSPSWSPGGRIAYWSTNAGAQSIYTTRFPGESSFRVTRPPRGVGDADPAWRPQA